VPVVLIGNDTADDAARRAGANAAKVALPRGPLLGTSSGLLTFQRAAWNEVAAKLQPIMDKVGVCL